VGKWILMVENNCNDPAHEDEFNESYNKIHAPDVLQVPGWYKMTRYVDIEPPEHWYNLPFMNKGKSKYLAIWEVEADDIDAAMKAHSDFMAIKRAQGRSVKHMQRIAGEVYKQIFEAEQKGVKPAKGKNRWILMVENNCNDPAHEDEFNEIYNNIHIPDVLEIPGWVRARRFVDIEPPEHWYDLPFMNKGKSKYLAIYEIVADDIDAAMKAHSDHMNIKRAQGRSPKYMQRVAGEVYKQIFQLEEDKTKKIR